MIRLYRTAQHVIMERNGGHFRLGETLDEVFRQQQPHAWLSQCSAEPCPPPEPTDLRAPVASQEVWAAGVTYLRSRDARMEESETAGAESLYDRVYEAERPELFFKASPWRVRGHGESIRIRQDGTWNVPEAELSLAINAAGSIFGYTIGNDMSSRDIEGENPLYLPQAKIYRGSCALGPALTIPEEPPPRSTAIRCQVSRREVIIFSGETSLESMKRSLDELAGWLFRELDFPHGAYLMTGTGIVPPASFTLQSGDIVEIEISGLGTLRNAVE